MSTKRKQKTRAELQREVAELHAQLVHVYHFAAAELHKAGTAHAMGGAVILQLTGLGGRQIINPVAIRDGLSDDTIAALRRDMVRSYELATAFKPKA